MTAEDKDIVQTWRRKRRADKLSEPKPKKKTGLGSLPVVTSTQKINVTTHDQTPNSHSTISSSVDSSVTDVQLTTIATKNPTVPSLSATSPTLPAIVVQDGDLSTAVPIVPSLSISDSSTASNSYTISTTQTSHSSTSNIFPILSVSNHNFPSILPNVHHFCSTNFNCFKQSLYLFCFPFGNVIVSFHSSVIRPFNHEF